MSKQVKTPRFYCDVPTYLHAIGHGEFFENNYHGKDLLYMNCSKQNISQISPDFNGNNYNTTHFVGRAAYGRTNYPINFMAALNHNFGFLSSSKSTNNFACADAHLSLGVKRLKYDWDTGQHDNAHEIVLTNLSDILNSNVGAMSIKPEWNGTSIWEFDKIYGIWAGFGVHLSTTHFPSYLTGELADNFNEGGRSGIGLGSFVIGKYWDAPYGPDLKLTMSRRFPGIKKQTSVGGKTFANRYYDGPAEWTMNGLRAAGGGDEVSNIYQYPPFEMDIPVPSSSINQLGDSYEYGTAYYKHRAKSGMGRKGLRSWKLTFSYMSEDDMWMAYESSSVAPFEHGETINTTTNSDIPEDGGNKVSSNIDDVQIDPVNPMLSDESFNYVWNVTLGGALPFMFQPDNTNNNPDQFAICTFKENSLKVTQVAHNTYSISVTIDELG